MDGGQLHLVDDFVRAMPADEDSAIMTIDFIEDALIYSDARARVVRRTAINPSTPVKSSAVPR
jgi:hypothetical protein